MEALFICVVNIVVIAIFAKLAIHFDKWWIILFSLMTLTSYKSDERQRSDSNGSEEPRPSYTRRWHA